MPIGNNCADKTYVKIMSKQTGKGAELIYAVDSRTGRTIANLMTIGNKTGKVFFYKGVPKTIGFDLDCYGRLKVAIHQGKASRCH